MKLLVVGSCTGAKDVKDCPYLLTETDLDDANLYRKRKAELKRWAIPAAQLYLGWQHRYMMEGVQLLRANCGTKSCTVDMISAGSIPLRG